MFVAGEILLAVAFPLLFFFGEVNGSFKFTDQWGNFYGRTIAFTAMVSVVMMSREGIAVVAQALARKYLNLPADNK